MIQRAFRTWWLGLGVGVVLLPMAGLGNDAVEVTLTNPVVIGETEGARARLAGLTAEAEREGVESIRLSGAISVDRRDGDESRVRVEWTEVSIDNREGEAITGALDVPLESRFRTRSPAVRAGNTMRARGDIAALAETIDRLLTDGSGERVGSGERGEGEAGDGEGLGDSERARGMLDGSPATTGVGNDPFSDDRFSNRSLSSDFEPCELEVNHGAGTVTPMARRVVMDDNGEIVAEGACAANGPTAQIVTDYQSCNAHIDHEENRIYQAYRQYATVDGRHVELKGCTADWDAELEQFRDYGSCPIDIDHANQRAYTMYMKRAEFAGQTYDVTGCIVDKEDELERVRDFDACNVLIPVVEAGEHAYPAFRWVAKDRDRGRDYVVSDCQADLNNGWLLEAQSGACGDDTSDWQTGLIYPQERIIYRDNDGVEQVAVRCRRIPEHAGFPVIETHDGCGYATLEGMAGRTVVRPMKRLIYYDEDNFLETARACQPTVEEAEVRHQVVGWEHKNGYSELMTEQVYDFQGDSWYWDNGRPSVFLRANHIYRTDHCSGVRHDHDAHISFQETRAVIDTTGEEFDAVRNQLGNVEADGVIEALACNSDNPRTVPHIKVGWSDWNVISSRQVQEETGALSLADSCTVELAVNRFYFDIEAGHGGTNRWMFEDGGYSEVINYDVSNGIRISGEDWETHNFRAPHPRWGGNNAAFLFGVRPHNMTSTWLSGVCESMSGSVLSTAFSGTDMDCRNECVAGTDQNPALLHLHTTGQGSSDGVPGWPIRVRRPDVDIRLSWTRDAVGDPGIPFQWAHPESTWERSQGCVELGEAGGAAERCTAEAQVRERVEVWRMPMLRADGSIEKWEEYRDETRIDRQTNYLTNL